MVFKLTKPHFIICTMLKKVFSHRLVCISMRRKMEVVF